MQNIHKFDIKISGGRYILIINTHSLQFLVIKCVRPCAVTYRVLQYCEKYHFRFESCQLLVQYLFVRYLPNICHDQNSNLLSGTKGLILEPPKMGFSQHESQNQDWQNRHSVSNPGLAHIVTFSVSLYHWKKGFRKRSKHLLPHM